MTLAELKAISDRLMAAAISETTQEDKFTALDEEYENIKQEMGRELTNEEFAELGKHFVAVAERKRTGEEYVTEVERLRALR